MKTRRGMACNNPLNVRRWRWGSLVLWGLAGIFLVGCAARTDVKLRKQYDGENPLPRPNLILVHNFVTSADTSGTPTSTAITDEEAEVGKFVADVLSKTLADEFQWMGLQAQKVMGEVTPEGSTLSIEGEFLHVEKGSQFKRLLIGFGVGSAEVISRVHIYLETDEEKIEVQEFLARAKSSAKPGMGPFVGVGALAGRAGTTAVVSGAVGVATEKRGGEIEAITTSLAREIMEHVRLLFDKQGWMEDDSVYFIPFTY
jgi:hypothetical protein